MGLDLSFLSSETGIGLRFYTLNLIISTPPLETSTGFDSLQSLTAGFTADLLNLDSFYWQTRFSPFLNTAWITLRLKALLDEDIDRSHETSPFYPSCKNC